MCFAKPVSQMTQSQYYRHKYGSKMRSNQRLANYFNIKYQNLRSKGVPVTKAFNIAKRGVQTQINTKGQIYVKKWKGTGELITTTPRYKGGKSLSTGKLHYLASRGRFNFKKKYYSKRGY